MSKKVRVAGQEYDSRTIVAEPEKLKIPNHPTVIAMAVPNLREGIIKIILKIKFGRLEEKEQLLISNSPKRIDAINKVIYTLKNTVAYKRMAA